MLDTLIRFHCPQCNKRLKAGPAAIGRRARCTRCGTPVQVPEQVTRREPVRVPASPSRGALSVTHILWEWIGGGW